VSERLFYDWLLLIAFILAAVVFTALFFIAAPYGRHSRSGWGHVINNKLGWIIMESAAPAAFLLLFIAGPNSGSITAITFLAMWELHYVHRAFIFPFSLRGKDSRITLAVVAMGLLFNTMNAYLNGRYVFNFSGGYPTDWLIGPRFITGAAIFIAGFIINRQADWTLRNLRRGNDSGYKIPYGGLYRWVSCPNYFGEILIWVGWAIATWSLPGLAFAVWTAANLAPRARSHQRWYREHFQDYPQQRKALVPLLW
jgi:3-oxo-5-alpha-steroid 4-dehydrogenase 1